jgi:hypothetical protein
MRTEPSIYLPVEREEKGRADHVPIPTQDFERGKVISIAEVRELVGK